MIDTGRQNDDEGNGEMSAETERLAFFGMEFPPVFVLWFVIVMAAISAFVIIFRTAEVLSIGASPHNIYITFIGAARDIATTIPVVSLTVALTVHLWRERVSIGAYFRQKTKEAREKSEAIGEARGEAKGTAVGRAQMAAEWSEWLERKEEAERNGEDFDEPKPKS